MRAVLSAEGRLSLGVTLDILDQVCAAVTQSHALGILHRDIKPENIHLEPDSRRGYRVKVLDFGIAKLFPVRALSQAASPSAGDVAPGADASRGTTSAALQAGDAIATAAGEESSLTRLGSAIGTPRYMAPEQRLGREVDVRVDVYSIGVVAYEMLVGELPFSAARFGDSRAEESEPVASAPAGLVERASWIPRRIARWSPPSRRAGGPAAHGGGVCFHAPCRDGGDRGRSFRSIALCLAHYGLLLRRTTSIVTLPMLATAAGIPRQRAMRAGGSRLLPRRRFAEA